ncbi:retrotransposon protein, partial [Trifolium medium]|nr:retrotransposon protein [Trifolium medium]
MLEDLDCTPDEKVAFATRYFRGPACNWWHNAKEYLGDINWENLCRLFRGQYVPDSFTFQMGRELGELKQG